jgi:hypothetical protein
MYKSRHRKRALLWLLPFLASSSFATISWFSVAEAEQRYNRELPAASAGWTKTTAVVVSDEHVNPGYNHKVTFEVIIPGQPNKQIERVLDDPPSAPAYKAVVHADGRDWTELDGVHNPSEPAYHGDGWIFGGIMSTIFSIPLCALGISKVYDVIPYLWRERRRKREEKALERKRKKAKLAQRSGTQQFIDELLEQLELIPDSEGVAEKQQLRRKLEALRPQFPAGNLAVIAESTKSLEAQLAAERELQS